ncbi:uncharacterized protein LOC115734192 isoform X2 [Rhodamnia argentea]|uniref:Uncharacterized protein LOC115734192 isoform X2 n=1 Tax=Rhodamnia argentea TaxID=178133 RepID=A0ABM3H1S9_9MYRT|nr:uncharacterized protein LOC115734192 isoform X2 [Rhodamnia argentea]
MASKFASSVDYGLMLSKRIYYGKGTAAAPAPPAMSRSPDSYLPTAPMVYAVVPDPTAVDNPDVPSYQPYVHGRCDPPALVPLQMHEVAMEVDCYLDTAFVSITGRWRMHCIMSSRTCDCQVAIPMGEQGLLLGIEVDVAGRSYKSQPIIVADMEDMSAEVAKARDGNFLNSQTFMFKVPQVVGGSTISVKANWSQKLTYQGSQFCLSIPFTFPSYVNPVVMKMPKKEKVLLNVNSGTGIELPCDHASHPLKDLLREAGKLSCFYEAEAAAWSSQDFKFSYSVSTTNISGGVLVQSPSLHDVDQRDMFCLYLYPGENQSGKAYSKEVVFVIDVSASMKNLLMNVKNVILESLSRLTQQDSFNILAFNNEAQLFSSLMEPATPEAISNATQWISANFTASGGTDILFPLEQAMKLLAETTASIPFIFLVTDGAVENEREICNKVKDRYSSGLPSCPRMCTFGIGAYCNNYFLRMLSQIGRGYHDASYDAESVELRMQRWLAHALSIMMADIAVDALENLNSLEIYPSEIPDLSSGSPLIMSGRFSGKFPELARVTGVLADRSICTIDLKVQQLKDVPVDRVLAKREIDDLTAQAWFHESIQLAEKVPEKVNFNKMLDLKGQRVILLGSLGKGFGNLTATAKNIPPGAEEKQSDTANVLVKAASNCCSKLLDRICCMCFIRTCSYVNDRCVVALTQLCTGLACFGCIDCCFDLCECCSCL